jgi:hypothetical protein
VSILKLRRRSAPYRRLFCHQIYPSGLSLDVRSTNSRILFSTTLGYEVFCLKRGISFVKRNSEESLNVEKRPEDCLKNNGNTIERDGSSEAQVLGEVA